MKNRYVMTLVLLPVLFSTLTLAVPANALAACSYNGLVNSGGKCDSSWWKPKPFAFPQYNYSANSIQQYIDYLEDLIALLKQQANGSTNFQSSVEVETKSAVNIDSDGAKLRGRLDLNNEDEAEVYFEYGKSRTNLSKVTKNITRDEEDDEDFDMTISNLDDDTLYYFRAVAIDEDNDKDYGVIFSFRTDTNSDDDKPTLKTNSAQNITNDSAEIGGSVDMNDFDDGKVFFVYGENENMIDAIPHDYDSYNNIEEDGDELQKVLVDSNLDFSSQYGQEINSLSSDTDIYYRICVAYESADDETLTCDDTMSFTTED